MSRVLVGQSYFLRFDAKLWAGMQPYAPLGSLYAAGQLRAEGHEVHFFDAMLAESEAAWGEALDRVQPEIAVVYEDNFNYLSKMCLLRMRQAAFTMIELARRRGCRVIVAGSDASDHADSYLAQGADFVLFGDGQQTLVELLERLAGRTDRPIESIAGLVHRPTPDGPAVRTERRPDLKDLDRLPFPAWDLVDLDRYRAIWLERHGYFSLNMATTRGCPFHCNWCAKPIWGQRYAVRSPANVVAELKLLSTSYRPDHIWFADDIFGLKPGWVAELAGLLADEGLRIPFKSLSRADLLLRDGEIDALARAGCRIVWIGAESGSQKILDAMEKGTRVDQIRSAARLLHQAGVQVGFFLQFGYPGETREDIELTLQMVRDCAPDDIGISVSYPLPGTRFYESVKEQLGLKQNWIDSDDLDMMYRGPFTTEFYRQLHVVVHKEFRARKHRSELWRVARGGGRWRPSHLRQAAALAANTATLPLARLQLDRLARRPHRGLDPLPPGLSPEAAAVPSPQLEG